MTIRNLAVLAAFAISLTPAFAQDTTNSAQDMRFHVMVDGAYGVVDPSGNYIVPAEYDNVTPWPGGLYYVLKDDKVAVFDSDGRMLVPFEFNHISYFRGERYTLANKDGYRLVINRSGKVVLGPGYPDFSILSDEHGLFAVSADGMSGIVNEACEWVLEPGAGGISSIESAAEGLAVATNASGEDGLIDLDGNWVIEPGTYEDVGRYEMGLVAVKQAGKWGFVDRSNNWVIPARYDARYGPPRFHRFHGHAEVEVDGKMGLLRPDGSFAIPPDYDRFFFVDALGASAERNGKYGYVDLNGNVQIPFEFDSIAAFGEDRRTIAKKDGRRFVIDDRGQELFSDQYSIVGMFGMGWAPATIDGDNWGAIDPKGNWLLAPEYFCVRHCVYRPGAPQPQYRRPSRTDPSLDFDPDFQSAAAKDQWCKFDD